MQGGDFSEDDRLLYITNGDNENACDCGIHVFEVTRVDLGGVCGSGPGNCVARRVDHSTNGSGTFNYEYHPGWSPSRGSLEEPEGITIWDFDVEGAPRPPGTTSTNQPVSGQLHVLLLDNDITNDDDVYIKHYWADALCDLQPGIGVEPLIVDFGDVGVGGVALQTVMATNLFRADLTVSGISLQQMSDAAFSIASAPVVPATIPPAGRVAVEVRFAPSGGGLVTGILELETDGPNAGSVLVNLAGAGVSFQEQANDLLDLFDEGVAAEALEGSGPRRSAKGRLRALRGMLEEAADLIEEGRIDEACGQLRSALDRTDGALPPEDFVAGPAAAALVGQIQQLRSNLKCT